jgi:hypothetical protein
MYYLDDIMDRACNNWGEMLGASDNSFWATSATIETKPSTETETTTPATPAETPAWEPADTKEWTESVEDTSGSNPTTDSNEWNTSTAEQIDSNPISETLQNITDTAKQVIDEINPFTDREPDQNS